MIKIYKNYSNNNNNDNNDCNTSIRSEDRPSRDIIIRKAITIFTKTELNLEGRIRWTPDWIAYDAS